VILFVLFNKAYPFNFEDKNKMLRLQLNRKQEFIRYILKKPSEELVDILIKMLKPNVEKRIKMDQLIVHSLRKSIKT
jgi:serine/threonine protein kinase